MLFSRDTPPETRRVLIDALRNASADERFRMTAEITFAGYALARAGAERDAPDAHSAKRQELFLRRWLGSKDGSAAFREWQRRNGPHG